MYIMDMYIYIVIYIQLYNHMPIIYDLWYMIPSKPQPIPKGACMALARSLDQGDVSERKAGPLLWMEWRGKIGRKPNQDVWFRNLDWSKNIKRKKKIGHDLWFRITDVDFTSVRPPDIGPQSADFPNKFGDHWIHGNTSPGGSRITESLISPTLDLCSLDWWKWERVTLW